MIERYSREPMKSIWLEERKFNYWLQVELAVCKAYFDLGRIPAEDYDNICQKACFDVNRIHEIEQEVHHDVIAFLTAIAENVGPSSRFIHIGMTSSDVIDTAFALTIRDSANIILHDLDILIEVLEQKAVQYRDCLMIGRSHGIHAEPITFGLKMLLWLDIMRRNKQRLISALEEIQAGKISGAVGTYANIDPQIEEIVCRELNLKPALVATQIIQRDLHAQYLQTLALIATTIEQFAVEIRSLQRTDVLEVEEPFQIGQKGSSAMPHKRNPVASENLSGLARVVRANSIAALENVPLWHERDISHSSVERIIFPDSNILVDYMLHRFTEVLRHLVVYPENMLRNMQRFGGIIFSQAVLLKLIEKGLTREKAYQLVQREAHRAWNQQEGDFKKNVLQSSELMEYLTPDDVETCFNVRHHTKQLDYIYSKMGLSTKV